MGLSETEVQKQLKHMIAFIEQEANEKAEEIDAKAEEEFNIEKGKLVQQQRTKIMEYYEKKEKQVELQRKIQSSNMLNQARLRVLKSREDHIKSVLDDARARLAKLASDPVKYEGILRGLISSSLGQMLESRCSLRCRQQDLKLVESLLPTCREDFSKLTKGSRKVDVTVDKSNFLPAECAGGVDLYAKDGKIRVDCTLESRLELISQKMLPDIRTSLFGTNPNRRFKD